MLTQGRALPGPSELFAPNSAAGLTHLQERTRVTGWNSGEDLAVTLHHGVRVETPLLGAQGASLRVERGMLWGHKATLNLDGTLRKVPVVVSPEGVQVDLPSGHKVHIRQTDSQELLVNVAAPLDDVTVEFRFAEPANPQVTRASHREAGVELRSPTSGILGDYLAVTREDETQRTVIDPLGAAPDFTPEDALALKARVLERFERSFTVPGGAPPCGP